MINPRAWLSTIFSIALLVQVFDITTAIPSVNDFNYPLEIGPNEQTTGVVKDGRGDFQYLIYSGLATYDQDTGALFTDNDLWGIGSIYPGCFPPLTPAS